MYEMEWYIEPQVCVQLCVECILFACLSISIYSPLKRDFDKKNDYTTIHGYLWFVLSLFKLLYEFSGKKINRKYWVINWIRNEWDRNVEAHFKFLPKGNH